MTSEPKPDLTFGRTWPDRETFRTMAADRRVIPVVRRLLADAETPLGVYRKLARDAPATFLLESAEHGGVWSRYSIIGARCSATLTEVDGQAYWIGEPPVGLPTSGDPTVALRDTVQDLRTGRCTHLRRGPALGTPAGRQHRRPGAPRADHDAGHRPRGARPCRRVA